MSTTWSPRNRSGRDVREFQDLHLAALAARFPEQRAFGDQLAKSLSGVASSESGRLDALHQCRSVVRLSRRGQGGIEASMMRRRCGSAALSSSGMASRWAL
jgi:hypothetical protein